MLHILNGDAVVPIFRKSAIPGDLAIWRELHCQGPTTLSIGMPEFRTIREKFLEEYLDLPYGFYGDTTNSQLNKIRSSLSEEVTLWFEYDLFCQINMMVAINFLIQIRPSVTIYLINVGQTFGNTQWYTLGQLNAQEWRDKYHSKKLLDKSAIDFMQSAWKIYCSADHRAFESIIHECPSVFKYFPLAIENHYRRFPSSLDNLTDIQRYIFENLNEQSYRSEKDVLRRLIQDFHFYGYGDLQYKAILRSLSHFIEFEPDQGYRLKRKFTGKIENGEISKLPEMIYGGQSNKEHFLEDFITL